MSNTMYFLAHVEDKISQAVLKKIVEEINGCNFCKNHPHITGGFGNIKRWIL